MIPPVSDVTFVISPRPPERRSYRECFLETVWKGTKNLGRAPPPSSKHLKGRLDPPVSDVFLSRKIITSFTGLRIIMVLVGFHGFSRWFHGFWLVSMVFQGGFMVFHGFWLVSMVFQGGFMIFHGFWLVSMVFQGGFIVFHGFWWVSMVSLVENTTKLYPGPTIQSRPYRP